MPKASPKTGAAAPRPYRCRSHPFPGTRYADLMPQSRRLSRGLQNRTKRRPYLRSAYFRGDKVFLDYFWDHLGQKAIPDRARRLRLLPCAVELIQNSREAPVTFIDAQQPDAIRHEFRGRGPDGSAFAVIVKQDRATGRKQFLSLFPLAE